MKVIVAEDNPSCCALLQDSLEAQGWEVEVAHGGLRAVEMLESQKYDVLLLDINLPEMDGFEVLQRARRISPEMKVVVISGSIGVVETVRAVKMGASECFPKPFNVDDLIVVLQKFVVVEEIADDAEQGNDEMVAVSASMRDVKRKLAIITKSKSTTVLITGETGSGKEVVARRMHYSSERSEKPFVAVNCSAIPPSLVESELFGHEKGAFTDARATRKGYFEASADGTIFLDEIGDLSLEMQAKLLRILQERNFRRVGGTSEIQLQARVIAATNVDLAQAVRAGKFREDLYYRLAVIPIHLLPLRERVEDIMPLCVRFVTQFSKEMGTPVPEFTDEHRETLTSHLWTGNVRELRNVMERFVLMGGRLEFVPTTRDLPTKAAPIPVKEKTTSVEDAERKMIYSLLLQKLIGSEMGSQDAARTLHFLNSQDRN